MKEIQFWEVFIYHVVGCPRVNFGWLTMGQLRLCYVDQVSFITKLAPVGFPRFYSFCKQNPTADVFCKTEFHCAFHFVLNISPKTEGSLPNFASDIKLIKANWLTSILTEIIRKLTVFSWFQGEQKLLNLLKFA